MEKLRMKPKEVKKTGSASAEENKALVRSLIEAINQQDWQRFASNQGCPGYPGREKLSRAIYAASSLRTNPISRPARRQNDPNIEANTITATSASAALTMPAIARSR